jgi:hypothetical protein
MASGTVIDMYAATRLPVALFAEAREDLFTLREMRCGLVTMDSGTIEGVDEIGTSLRGTRRKSLSTGVRIQNHSEGWPHSAFDFTCWGRK